MRFPGVFWADMDERGIAHVAPEGFPGDLARYTRCSRSGQRIAAVGNGGSNQPDPVWEYADGAWKPRQEKSIGPRAVIYIGEELQVQQSGPAYGYRYVVNGTIVRASETYAHSTLPVYEYTILANGWIVGQGGSGPWGEDPLVILPGDGTRRLVATGMCRFINAYLVGDRIDLAWQQDGRGSDARSLTLAEVLTLPDAPVKQDEPEQPTPEPEPEPMPELPESLFPTVEAVRAKYSQPTQDDLGVMLNEIAWIHRDKGWGLNRKTGGNHTVQPRTGERVAVDILHHKPSDTIWDVFGDAGGATTPSWGQAHPHGDPSRIWIAPVEPVGADPTEPEPQPDYAAQIAELREVAESFAGLIRAIESSVLAQDGVIEALASRIEALERTPPASFDPNQYEARGPVTLGWWTKTATLPIVKK